MSKSESELWSAKTAKKILYNQHKMAAEFDIMLQ